MNYKRLSIEDREKIHILINQGKSNRMIAEELDRSHTTIAREVSRFRTRFEYSPSKAHELASRLKPKTGRKLLAKIRPELWEESVRRIILDNSSEQISKSFKLESPDDPSKWISHETIYKYIYATPKGELKKILNAHLRGKRISRKNRNTAHAQRGQIQDATHISERPKEVDSRAVPGHWEGDLIIGKNHKSALGTLVKRTTRLVILVPIPGKKDAKTVREAFVEVFKEIDPQMRLSMTYDRGLEMSEHKILTEETGVKVYFANPNSPWQRGTNENTNGLLRQYFPKGTDFSKVTMNQIKFAQERLNNRPRKVLNWKTPKEEFKRLLGALET